MAKYNRMKHVVTDLMEAALATGYDYEFLCERVDEAIEDGESLEEAVEDVLDIAYEFDF